VAGGGVGWRAGQTTLGLWQVCNIAGWLKPCILNRLIVSFIWFEGYDETQHAAMGTNVKIEQHKENRAR